MIKSCFQWVSLFLLTGIVVPQLALAQGQIDAGRSNDASNRIGSGGRNAQYSNTGNSIQDAGNRIITGNVTQGREFRGNVGYADPYSFRGPTSAQGMDNFIKNSTGVPQAYTREGPPNVSTPFYGLSNTVQQPPGFMEQPNRGFVPPPPKTGTRGFEDQRLGVVDLNQPISPIMTPGQFMGRGTLNAQGQAPGVITGSTLYGVREWNPQDPADRFFLENILNRQNNALDRLNLDPRDAQRMRDELQKAIQGETTTPASGTKTPGSLGQEPRGKSFDSPVDSGLVTKPLGDQMQNSALAPQGMSTEQGTRMNILGAARRTSTQYAELNKRLEQYYADRKKTDADFAREFNAQLRAKAEAEAKAKAAVAKKNAAGQPEVAPAQPAMPGEKEDPAKKKKPKPLKVATLAQGVKAEGLSNILKKAEGLMKEGKYASALDQYDAAEIVAPNNPLIWLGRANAELGAGFFVRAENHLRQAFMTDKSLLMGQYDLTAMLGEERMGKIVAELKDIANKDTKAMPVFLLAYIAYNTGHERQAVGYLDLAEKRSGERDLFFKMLREHWSLPDDGTGPAMNK